MPLSLDPLAAFQTGQVIGQANSPVTGIGMAIKNIVEDARQKGLLQAQSTYQAMGSDVAARAKESREEARLGLPTSTIFAKPSGETVEVPHTRGQEVKSFPAENSLESILMEGLRGALKTGTTTNNQGPQAGNVPAFATEAELEAAVQSGSVKVGDKVIVGGVSGTYQ